MKQETLEEVAFTAGEEAFKEFRKGILEANRFDFVCGFTAGAKWQQEQMYSEEEFKEMVYHMFGALAHANNMTFNGAILDELFNKFKK